MNAHKKIHQREDIVDLRRNLPLDDTTGSEETVVVMDFATAAPTTAPNSADLNPEPAFNFAVQWKDITEKNKLIEELKEKVSELENDVEIMRKKSEKDHKEWDLAEMKKELNRTVEKASSLCEENTLLKEQVKTYQNREIANSEIQRKYDDRLKVVMVTAGCQTEDQDEAADIEVLNRGRLTGFRRTDPASPPAAVDSASAEQAQHNCNLCYFMSQASCASNTIYSGVETNSATWPSPFCQHLPCSWWDEG